MKKLLIIILVLIAISCDNPTNTNEYEYSLKLSYSGNCQPMDIYVNGICEGYLKAGESKIYEAAPGHNIFTADGELHTFFLSASHKQHTYGWSCTVH